jgi:hypothetical protein
MVTPLFSVYGAGDDHHVLLMRGAASPDVSLRYAATWMSSSLPAFGSDQWYVGCEGFSADALATALLESDTVPADQGGIVDFAVPSEAGTSMVLPLDTGEFVVVAGSHVYIQRPDDTSYVSRLTLSNMGVGGNHHVVAVALVGGNVTIMYATRGNATRSARVLTISATDAPSGIVDLSAMPTYGSSIPGDAPWQLDPQASFNWYTGLIPHVMGAFDYCVYRNADRSADGLTSPMMGIAIGAPYNSGGERVMSGYQSQENDAGSDVTFRLATFGGTMAGTNLAAQSQIFGDVTAMSAVIGASGLSPVEYYFDAYRCSINLSFVAPPGPPAFWTNLRLAVEVI